MTEQAPRKFGFDTWFNDDGQVLAQAPAVRSRRAYSPAEVEVIRDQAFADGQADQRQRDESLTAQSLSDVRQACAQAMGALDAVVTRYRANCADLALATGEAIAAGALEQFQQAPLTAALEALSEEVAGTARLVVRTGVAGPEAKALIEKAAADAGFAGRIVVRDEPGGAPAAFVIEWPDGRAEYDPSATADRVRAALQSALLAEADGGIDLMNGDA